MHSKRLIIAVLVVALSSTGCTRRHAVSRSVGEFGARWQWLAPPPSYVGMPAADRNGVAVTFGQHGLVMLTAAGAVEWLVERDELRDVAPALGTDLVVAGTEAALLAFDRATGTQRWSLPLGGERPTSPVLSPDVAAVLTWEGHAVAADRHNGRQLWRVALPGGAIAAPVTDGNVVVGSWEESTAAGVVALDAHTGATRWSRPVASGGVSGPALVEGGTGTNVVVLAGDRRIHAFDLSDGSERWTLESSGGAGSPEVPPATAGTEVVVADRLTGITSVAGRVGQSRWRTLGPGAAVRGGPVVVGGLVVLPLDAGGLLVSAGGRRPHLYRTDGRVSGLARSGELLVVATREGARNALTALRRVSRS